MARVFTHKDGRLKTGRVAALVFAGLLAVSGMLFKINSSVDHALLVVKHVFEPEKIQPTENKPAIKQGIARIKSPRNKDAEPKEVRWPDETRTEGKKKVAPAGNKKTEAATEISSAESVNDTEKSPFPEKAARTGNKKSGEAEKIEPESDGNVASDQAALKKIARKSSEPKPEKLKSEPGTINVSEKLNRLISAPDQPIKKASTVTPKAPRDLRKRKFPADAPHKREVTVDPKRYKDLFHSWQIAGKTGKGKDKLPLRVENLRDSYDLFQMKPVAVISGKAFLDLSDGTRVAEKSLEEYSATVFRVDRPWDKWGDALAAAGIRRGEKFEVRYYMYDFIKDAIYARVNQAFSWCRESGLISKNLPENSVDVLGRAYIINRRGGGRFGVFVPVFLDIGDGRRVAVDPVCFKGQADVETLRQAGLL